MRKAWIAVLVSALALVSSSASRAVAQDMEFSLDETETGGGDATSSDAGSGSGDVIGDLAGGGDQQAQASQARDTPAATSEAR